MIMKEPIDSRPTERPAGGQSPRRSNLRTALIVGSIAAVFFFGVIADHIIAKKLGLEPAPGAGSGMRR